MIMAGPCAVESIEQALTIAHLVKEHPDLCLFVQTNPAFCCPSLVTEAMASKIEGGPYRRKAWPAAALFPAGFR